MKKFRLDVSLICFGLVVVAAVPVTLLRTKTYALGYEIGKRKQTEKTLLNKKDRLTQELASKKRSIRDASAGTFAFPAPDKIMRHGDAR